MEALADPRVLQHDQRPLRGQLDLAGTWLARGCLPVRAQTGGGDVGLVALRADERSLVVVQPPVQFEVHVLGERLRALVAAVRLVIRVQPLVRLKI